MLKKLKHGWDNGTVLLGPVMRKGQGTHRWSFRTVRGCKATVGIALLDVDLNTFLNKTEKGWGYYQWNGNKGTKGPALERYASEWQEPGTVVSVLFDADKTEVRFAKNGKDLGVAFDSTRLPRDGSFVVGVSLYKQGDAIAVVQSSDPAPVVLCTLPLTTSHPRA